MTTIDGLRLRRVMGRKLWHAPEPYGPDGWKMVRPFDGTGIGSLIVSSTDLPDDPTVWTHASVAYTDRLPTYDDLCLLKRAVWGDDGYAYQVFVPASEHVNIHEFALHLWGRADGSPVLPEFTRLAGVRSI